MLSNPLGVFHNPDRLLDNEMIRKFCIEFGKSDKFAKKNCINQIR